MEIQQACWLWCTLGMFVLGITSGHWYREQSISQLDVGRLERALTEIQQGGDAARVRGRGRDAADNGVGTALCCIESRH